MVKFHVDTTGEQGEREDDWRDHFSRVDRIKLRCSEVKLEKFNEFIIRWIA